MTSGISKRTHLCSFDFVFVCRNWTSGQRMQQQVNSASSSLRRCPLIRTTKCNVSLSLRMFPVRPSKNCQNPWCLKVNWLIEAMHVRRKSRVLCWVTCFRQSFAGLQSSHRQSGIRSLRPTQVMWNSLCGQCWIDGQRTTYLWSGRNELTIFRQVMTLREPEATLPHTQALGA